MAEKSLYRTANAPTLATSAEMWSLSDDEVRRNLLENLPALHGTVANWFMQRPSMSQTFTLNRPYSQPYERNMLTRHADCVRYAIDETHEFLTAVRTKRNIKDVKSEFGDILFWLALYDQGFVGSGRVFIAHDVNTDSVIFTPRILGGGATLQDRKTLTKLGGEEAILTAVSLLERQFAGDIHLRGNSDREKTDAYLDLTMLTLARYAIALGWDIKDIIIRVAKKNDTNYPKELFNRVSPFLYDIHSIDFLNLLKQAGHKRNYFEGQVSTIFTSQEMDDIRKLHPSQFPPGLVQKYRNIVQAQLEAILQLPENHHQYLARELLKTGQWDDDLLKNYYADPNDIY